MASHRIASKSIEKFAIIIIIIMIIIIMMMIMIIIIVIIINLIYIAQFDTNSTLTALHIVTTYRQMQYVHI